MAKSRIKSKSLAKKIKSQATLSEDQTWDFISPEGEEDEEDLDSSNKKAFDDVVLGGADWTTETILSQLRQGNIILSPHFQRREAWVPARQSRFIESLFLGLPVPQLVLAESAKHRGKYVVIDGKQRLLSLQHFAGFEHAQIPALRLSGLKIREELNGMTYPELKADSELNLEVSRFENQTIRTVVIKNCKDESYIYLVFLRLNTESVKLSPQELRLALHPGKFMDFAVKRSAESAPLMAALGLKAPDFRMRDVEIFVRFFGFRYRITNYAGNLKKFLDETCRLLNDTWEKNSAEIEAEANRLDAAITCCHDIFGGNYFRKWDGKNYERRFNRAIFDVMVYYFAEPDIVKAAEKKKVEIEAAFKNLCSSSDEFVRSVETTTKSIDATQTRLALWGKKLRKLLGASVKIPAIARKVK